MVHVSGHASAGELLYCYNIVKPRNVMPVHGESRHLIANADLAVATGVPRERTIVAEDGAVDRPAATARRTVVGKVDAGYIFVDGSTVGDISEAALTDRRILGEEGFISDRRGGQHPRRDDHQRPRHPRPRLRRGRHVFDAVRPLIVEALEDALRDGVDDAYRAAAGRSAAGLGRWVNDTHRRRPMIIPVVIQA